MLYKQFGVSYIVELQVCVHNSYYYLLFIPLSDKGSPPLIFYFYLLDFSFIYLPFKNTYNFIFSPFYYQPLVCNCDFNKKLFIRNNVYDKLTFARSARYLSKAKDSFSVLKLFAVSVVF